MEDQELEKLVQASTSIIYLKLMILALPIMFAVSWLPGMGTVGKWGFLILLIALPVTATVWWLKYRSVRPDDVFLKKPVLFYPVIAFAIWAFVLVVWLAVPAIFLQRQIRKAEAELPNVPRDYRTVVIVKDLNNVYWAFTADRIVQIDKNKVIVQPGSLLTRSDSSMIPTPAQVGDCFLEMRYAHRYNRTGWPFVSCPSAKLRFVPEVAGMDGKDMEIEVKEVALTRVPEGRS